MSSAFDTIEIVGGYVTVGGLAKAIAQAVKEGIALEREACAAEMDRRAEERASDLVASAAYRNAARVIRERS